MSKEVQKSVSNHQSDTSDMNNRNASNNENVPADDRRLEVLDFLREHDMPLPPLAIFGGLKRQRSINFSYRTVQNSLADLLEEGDVIRVDTAELRENARIEPVKEGSKKRAYYFITDSGRDRLHEELE